MSKRHIEREHLGLFLRAYEEVTGETFPIVDDSETPDFVTKDANGKTVGIELTQLRFGPDERHMRNIFGTSPSDPDAWWRLIALLAKKTTTLSKGNWCNCDRKILVVMVVDTTIGALDFDTDRPEEGGFDEIWLADHSQFEAFGAVDLFALVHRELDGHFSTGNWGQKPYG